MLMRAIKKPKM